MRRLCSLLGMPQNRFASVHVVGTNGKTSVARMTAALLDAHQVSAAAYVSPHISSWRERVVIHGEPIGQEAFGAAIERAEAAAQAADRVAGEEGPVTQFELVTAAAFLALASARVQVGVIEAGLGGRLDATNVIPSRVTVLTSVGLDHTEWLGDTLVEIAAEKLAVLRDHTKLIAGEVPEEVVPIVNREVERRHSEVRWVRGAGSAVPDAGHSYQRHNLALAMAATEVIIGRLDRDVVMRLFRRGELSIPGRAEVVPGDPPLVFDAAHNPDGARALAEALRDPDGLTGGHPVVCCFATLEEKDASGIVAALAPVCTAFVCTQVPEGAIRGSGRPVGRSRGAAELAELCREAGAEAEAVPDPLQAWRRATELASERHTAALAAGSHYLLSCIWTERPDQSF
jgi:dihydrofolate synthase/folylpolyglutamate synthase